MELLIVLWLGFAVVTAIAAKARGRDPIMWAVIGAIGGVFGLIAILVMKDESGGA